MLDRVTPSEYFIQGRRYARVTKVLDCLAGLSDMGPAIADIAAREISTAASDICIGVIPRATDVVDYESFVQFLATDDGKKWAKGRYFAGLGDMADTGTIVDAAFQDIAANGAWFDNRDAVDWVMAEVEAINESRKLTKTEYESAIALEDLPKVEELKGKPMFPAHVDIHGAAKRIIQLQHWWADSGLECLQTQGTLKCETDGVAGTFDLLAKATDGTPVLIDLKTSNKEQAKHAAQVGKYADMLGLECEWWLVYARVNSDNPHGKVYRYEVKDKEKARKLWRWALALFRFQQPGLFARAKTFTASFEDAMTAGIAS